MEIQFKARGTPGRQVGKKLVKHFLFRIPGILKQKLSVFPENEKQKLQKLPKIGGFWTLRGPSSPVIGPRQVLISDFGEGQHGL